MHSGVKAVNMVMKKLEPNERRRIIGKALANALMEDKEISTGQHIGRLLFGNMDRAIIDYRNDIALSAIRRQLEDDPNSSLVLLWGAAHLPGISKGLTLDGYRKSDEVAIPAMVL